MRTTIITTTRTVTTTPITVTSTAEERGGASKAMGAAMGATMGGDLALELLIWTSPAFPVGAFAYSHGLEWAHEAGDVTDAASLEAWLADLLAHGAARNDAVLAARAWHAAQDVPALIDLAELGVALATSAERRLETVTQGNAFLTVAAASWPCPPLHAYRAAQDGDTPYPVAFGLVAGAHAIALGETLDALLLGFVQNLVSAAIRLGAIGQTDGQRVVAALLPTIRAEAAGAREAGLDDLGAAVFRSDLGSLLHETQYTRLFRS